MSNGEKLCCPFVWNCLFVSIIRGRSTVSRVRRSIITCSNESLYFSAVTSFPIVSLSLFNQTVDFSSKVILFL